MHVFVPCVRLTAKEARQLLATKWVLTTKSKSSARTVSALKLWTISPALQGVDFQQKLMQL